MHDDAFQMVVERNPNEPGFHRAVRRISDSVAAAIERHPAFGRARILERIAEPERVILFPVPWIDDRGGVQINKGYRVEMSSVLGPFVGGLRFHPSVGLDLFKTLAFDLIFKNSLTTLPLGAASGGADFNPKGRSDTEIMRFCQSFMTELWRHVDADGDIVSGDIGVGGREIGYLFGMYRKLANRFRSLLIAKGRRWGGIPLRREATGWGVVYFTEEMLGTRGMTLDGKRCLISGSGGIARFAAEKAVDRGARVLTLSDSTGFLLDEEGLDHAKLAHVAELRDRDHRPLRDYTARYPQAVFIEFDLSQGYNPLWQVAADVVLPCATVNEINPRDAENLARNRATCVCEGTSGSVAPDAVARLLEGDTLFGPGMASTAGSAVVAGLEVAQSCQRLVWTREEVDRHLRQIVQEIHHDVLDAATTHARPGTAIDTARGADIAAFLRVANAMLDMGVV